MTSPKHFTYFGAPVNAERLRDVAARELGETPEVKERCLTELRKLINDENVTCIMTDDFLLRFLRVKKFDVQRSFLTLKNYARHRVTHHNSILKFQPEVMLKILRQTFEGIFPCLDNEERVICFARGGIWNPSICSVEDLLMMIFVVGNYVCEQQSSSQITGLIFIYECKKVNYYDVTYMIRNIGHIIDLCFNSLPLRLSRIHIVNPTFLVKCALHIVLPILPKKWRERVLLHRESTEVLFQHVDPTILPNEFGGSYGPVSNDHLEEELVNYLTKLKDQQRFFIG